MSQMHFVMMVAGQATAGMEDYVKRFLVNFVAKSRRDAGCVVYNVHRSTEDEGQFMLYTVWESEDAFNKHNQQPHTLEFKEKLVDAMFDLQSPKTHWLLIDE